MVMVEACRFWGVVFVGKGRKRKKKANKTNQKEINLVSKVILKSTRENKSGEISK